MRGKVEKILALMRGCVGGILVPDWMIPMVDPHLWAKALLPHGGHLWMYGGSPRYCGNPSSVGSKTSRTDRSFFRDFIRSVRDTHRFVRDLERGGVECSVPESSLRMSAEHITEADDGGVDFFVGRDLHSVQIKYRGYSFREPSDFPFDTVIVDTVLGWEKLQTVPDWYLLTNSRRDRFMALDVSETRSEWVVEEKYDPTRLNDREFHSCPKDLFLSQEEFIERFTSGSQVSPAEVSVGVKPGDLHFPWADSLITLQRTGLWLKGVRSLPSQYAYDDFSKGVVESNPLVSMFTTDCYSFPDEVDVLSLPASLRRQAAEGRVLLFWEPEVSEVEHSIVVKPSRLK